MGAKPLTQDEKETILELFNKGCTRVQISKEINRHPSSVSNYIKTLGLKFSGNTYKKKITESEILSMIDMYNRRISCATIKKELNLSIDENTMRSIMRERGINIRPRGNIPFLIENEDFFEEIDCEEKAYVLGLLISDGYIVKPKKKNPVWGLSLKKTDEYLLEMIKKYIGIKDKKLVNDRDNCSVLTITSAKMVSDLKRYGVTERKSHTVRIPKAIPTELISHLIRGIFDGDGTVFTNSLDRLYFGFYGNYAIVEEIKSILTNRFNISDNKITDKETVAQMTFSKKEDILNFYNFIYSNSTVWMKRKKILFEEYLKNNI